MHSRVSLAELIECEFPLRPDEAVAIVRDVCRQYAAGGLHGIPGATVIRLTPAGRILVEGPVSRDQDAVRAAASLLSDLLPGFDAPNGFKVPGGLRLVMARAARTIDLPPFPDTAAFSAALDRFAGPDLEGTVQRLYRSWAGRGGGSLRDRGTDLTISDVRRARRATGLTLDDVARASGIAAPRLRELEWGYLRHWRADAQGREDMRRYARAAGLDEQVVVAVASPLAESAAWDRLPEPAAENREGTWALVPAPPRDAVLPAVLPSHAPGRTWRDRCRRAMGFTAAVLLAVSALVLEWQRPVTTAAASAPRHEPPLVQPQARTAGAPFVVGAPVRRASLVRPLPPSPRRVSVKRARPPAPKARKPFLTRELLRIVIK